MKNLELGPESRFVDSGDDFKNIDAFKVHLVPTLADAASRPFRTRAVAGDKT
jgi:hypothetical protein